MNSPAERSLKPIAAREQAYKQDSLNAHTRSGVNQSADDAISSLQNVPIDATSRHPDATRPKPNSLKKLASSLSLSAAFKGKSARSKQGFDLSDWNHDLAAIASHPSSSSSANSPVDDSTSSLPWTRASHNTAVVESDLVPPATHVCSSLPRSVPLSHVLEPSTAESRRRKSGEMEEDVRDTFNPMSYAPPTRREPHGHSRTHSLAHAHSIRSSRQLSYHGSLADSPHRSPRASTSASPFGSPYSPKPPVTRQAIAFMAPFPSAMQEDDSAPPPSKRISLESACERDYVESMPPDNVFGGSLLGSPAKKPSRTKSLSRPSVPSFNITPMSSSNSHPGWFGDGFETRAGASLGSPELPSAAPPTSTAKATGVRTRSRAASNATALQTLDEQAPSNYFAESKRSSLGEMSATHDGVELETATPPRRRSDGFNLFGQNVSATSSSLRKAIDRRSSISMPNCTLGDAGSDEEESPDEDFDMQPHRRRSLVSQSPPAVRRVANLPLAPTSPEILAMDQQFSSRRATSLDSLFSASLQPGEAPSPFGRPGTVSTPNGHQHAVHASIHRLPVNIGRKRNANGALLVGSAGVSSKLGAVSPIVAPSSPATWNVRDSREEIEDDEDDEEDAEAMESEVSGNWGHLSPPPPALTDGTTSASSSLSTSLSSHAEGGDHVSVARPSASVSSRSLGESASGPSPSGGAFFTPQNYKNVKPLASAFMSTGLISKRSRPRSSSIVNGLPFNLHQHPMQSKLDERAAGESAAAASVDPEATSSTAPPSNPLLSRASASVMPDTPVKKSVFITSTSGKNLALQGDSLSPLGISSCNDDGSTGGRSSRASNDDERPELSSNDLSPARSPSTLGVPGVRGDMSPSVHASRGSTRVSTGRPSRMRPVLFRRRSSGQLSSEGSFLGSYTGRSGSSSGSSSGATLTLEGEPMTPTRSSGTKWEGKQSMVMELRTLNGA